MVFTSESFTPSSRKLVIVYDVTGGYNMEFRRIEYFLVLAEKLNFNQAAKELCISAPALTKQIHLLEE